MSGQKLFLRLRDAAGDAVALAGWKVEEFDKEVVVACLPSRLENIPRAVVKAGGESQPSIGFVRVPGEAVASVHPAGWESQISKQVPDFRASMSLWFGGEVAVLESSEAEVAPARKASVKKVASSSSHPLLSGLQKMDLDFFAEQEADSEEESEAEEEEVKFGRRLAGGVLPPGGTVPKSERKEAKGSKKSEDPQLLKALSSSLLAGGNASSSDLTNIVLLKMLERMEKSETKRDRKKKEADELWDPLGGSASDSEEEGATNRSGGMRAMNSLHKMQNRVNSHPKRICLAFEEEAAADLGIIPGQAWTLKDWLRKHQWGRFKGLFRCAIMDVSAYELIRAGKPEVAAAQLAQNMKAKVQAVIDGGDWTAAWLLTGLSDPMGRREFGGSKSEMAVVSGYLSALNKLKKQVKEVEGGGAHHEDEEAEASTKTKK